MDFFKELGVAWDLAKVVPAEINGELCWNEKYQSILQAGVWARHFPKVKYIHNNETVLFSHFEEGIKGEILYRTASISGQGIERSILDEYLEDLRLLEEYAMTCPGGKELIEQLKLPVPFYAAERLRLYVGADGNIHLAVFWGFIESKDMEVAPAFPVDGYGRFFEEFVPDMRSVPKKSHVRLAMLLIAVAFVLLVFTMSRSGRVVKGPGMQPPDIEFAGDSGPLQVNPDGLVEKGAVVAVKSGYDGQLEIAGTVNSVLPREVQYHCFDQVGNYSVMLFPDNASDPEMAFVVVRDKNTKLDKPLPSSVIVPCFPVVGEPVRAVNTSALPSGIKVEKCRVRWNGGDLMEIDERVSFPKAGMHRAVLEITLSDGSVINSEKVFPVFDASGACPGYEGHVIKPRMVLYPRTGVARTRQNVYVCDASEGRRGDIVDRLVNWGDGRGNHIPAGTNRLKHTYRKPGTYTVQLFYGLKSGKKVCVETKLKVEAPE